MHGHWLQVNHVCDVLTHVEQIAGAFIAISSKGLFHDLLLSGLGHSVVI